MGYLVCNKCGGYYELQPGESPKDFDLKCECGGELLIENRTNQIMDKKSYKDDDIQKLSADSEDDLFCPECGIKTKKESIFCIKCGNPLKKTPEMPKSIICQNCGSDNIVYANFCQDCGKKLKNINDQGYDHRETFMIISSHSSKYYASLNSDGIDVKIGPSFTKKAKNYHIKYEDITNLEFKLKGTQYGQVSINGEKLDKILVIKSIPNHIGKLFEKRAHEIISTGTLKHYAEINTEKIPIYSGSVNKPYTVIGEINARADSSLLSKTATMADVNFRLREEAVKIGANAIVNAKYDRSSVTSWRGVKASATAVFMESNEKKCPFCAEIIKKEAIKCKHCGSDLTLS